ncbi:hypothetical protein L1987_18721 [Smallanthus sonchifolius]|uniref:Uncharacterized protein n=1 Tax=Smallanthus sonchifolius TaxID=185202 RepID=A0ACB9J0J5_9ASTR|nr:hypothetical protein L1987_18721 [Smallanthus sonchifolius]
MPLRSGAGKFLGYMRLTSRVASLNRFISRSSERCREFYDILKKNKRFEWEEKHEQALQPLKEYLSAAPLLTKPEDGEPLSLYLAISSNSVRAVLVKDHEGQQHPVYYVNLEVQQFKESMDKWTLFIDGASNVRRTGLGIIHKSPQGDIITQSISCEFQATNNEEEYVAMIAGLQLAWDIKIRYLQVYVDSLIIANHLNGSYAVKGEKLAKYLTIVKQLSTKFEIFSITQVPTKDNAAYALANLSSALKIPEGPNLRCLEDPETHEVFKDIHEDRTTTNNATDQTPFSLVFGTEAMIPTEMVIPTARTSLQTKETNNEALAHDLDTADELRYLAKICIAAYPQRIAKSYNKNIRIRRFQMGDLVFRKEFQNTTNLNDGKLPPKWEGPYLIDSEASKGAYCTDLSIGEVLARLTPTFTKVSCFAERIPRIEFEQSTWSARYSSIVQGGATSPCNTG